MEDTSFYDRFSDGMGNPFDFQLALHELQDELQRDIDEWQKDFLSSFFTVVPAIAETDLLLRFVGPMQMSIGNYIEHYEAYVQGRPWQADQALIEQARTAAYRGLTASKNAAAQYFVEVHYEI